MRMACLSAVLSVAAFPALADIQYCNGTSGTLEVAAGLRYPGIDMMTRLRGWFTLTPTECVIVLPFRGSLEDHKLLAYGRDRATGVVWKADLDRSRTACVDGTRPSGETRWDCELRVAKEAWSSTGFWVPETAFDYHKEQLEINLLSTKCGGVTPCNYLPFVTVGNLGPLSPRESAELSSGKYFRRDSSGVSRNVVARPLTQTLVFTSDR